MGVIYAVTHHRPAPLGPNEVPKLSALPAPAALSPKVEAPVPAPVPPSPPGGLHTVSVPEFDATTAKPSLPDVDPATISKDNPGYVIDLDGDGVDDFVKMESNILSWTKRPVDQNKPVAVLTIKGDIIAYNVLVRPGDTRPSVLFWNAKYKGFFQRCAGVAVGKPFFGAVEEQ